MLHSFNAGSLRGVFHGLKRQHILQDVQTLILDGLSVTSDLISEILLNDAFRVRLISIREVKNLNERKLMNALECAIKPRRPNTPTLKGIYLFGPKDPPIELAHGHRARNLEDSQLDALSATGAISSQGAQTQSQLRQKPTQGPRRPLSRDENSWYHQYGEIFRKSPTPGWEKVMLLCSGIISFDGVLCNGPRHNLPLAHKETPTDKIPWYSRPDVHLPTAIATIALGGCSVCHSAPEGMFVSGVTPPESLPLLAPPPLHSSTIKAATQPRTTGSYNKNRLLARCKGCLRGRYCESCQKWWCEDCFENSAPGQSPQHPEFVFSAFEEVRPKDGAEANNLKVYMGLCVEDCLIKEMMSGIMKR
jgi:hypothetical protein